ncbi:uncharacterized protein LOC143465133 [Clavelina lepadiformis]|uniref:uncharacterized protein LOC143465133 n=1 Tax=Clavelina lepadiformis TaxID=159417 RepID=UPI0040420410
MSRSSQSLLLLLISLLCLVVNSFQTPNTRRAGRNSTNEVKGLLEESDLGDSESPSQEHLTLPGLSEPSPGENSNPVPRIQPTRRKHAKTFPTVLAAHIQEYMSGINCKAAKRFFTTPRRCEMIQTTPFEQMRFYHTPLRGNRVVSVAMPEGKLKNHRSHHAVAVVDPFPRANFGHLVMVFYIDWASKAICSRKHGFQIERGLCLTHARRNTCRSHYRSRLNSDQLAKKCEVNFIPLVYDEIKAHSGRGQLLSCVPFVAGFGECPKQPVISPDMSGNCELAKNTKRCLNKRSSNERRHRSMCRSFATCDYAVAVFGSWSSVKNRSFYKENMRSFYEMLRRNGFGRNEIQIFSDEIDFDLFRSPLPFTSPASNKAAVRNHISTLCHSALCVDSLVIFLNGPATSNGALLLKDINKNGVADTNELYGVNEILADVAQCDANHLFIFVDQSYSGAMTLALRQRIHDDEFAAERRSTWNRVVLLTSGDAWEWSWYRDATEHWSNLTPSKRMAWAYWGLENGGRNQPTLTQQGHHAEDYTIYGAPVIQGLPEFSDDRAQLKRSHMGCQKISLGSFLTSMSNKRK